MESAAVGRGHVDSGPELGPVSWCATKQVCRCACDGGGVSIYRGANASVDFAMVSLQLSYVFARIILCFPSASYISLSVS